MKKNLLIKSRIIAFLSIALFAAIIVSCKDDEITIPENDYSNIIDESYASEVYDEIEDLGDEANIYLDNTIKSVSETAGNYNRLSPCATVTRVYEEDLAITTIDFGEANCLCNDGRERRGKILINHYGHYWEGDVEINYSFENYFVDDNQLTGTKNVLRTMNIAGNRQSDIIIDGIMILSDNAGTISWYTERTREVVNGSDTKDKDDDIIEITGFSYGTLADSTEISCEILTPLVRKYEIGCFKYFVSGIRRIINGEESEMIIDYGDGACDNIAEVTQDGITTVIEIHRKKHVN